MSLAYRAQVAGHNVKDLASCEKLVSSLDFKYVIRLLRNRRPWEQTLSDKKERIRFLGKGGQSSVYLVESPACGDIVVKVVEKKDNTKREIQLVPRIKRLVDDFICPNFLYYYGVRHVGPNALILCEYADGSLEDWLRTQHSYAEWRSFLFQFLVAVRCLQTVLLTYHNDLKPKNLLYKRLARPDTIFEYQVADQQYRVPTHGYLHMVTDFGHAQSLLLPKNAMNQEQIKGHIRDGDDLTHIVTLHKRILVNAIEKVYTFQDLSKLIEEQRDEYFAGYLRNERARIDRDLSKRPGWQRDKMLYRSVAYYVVEKGYINHSSIPEASLPMKLPPVEIVDEISHWTDHRDVGEILATFNEYKVPVAGAPTGKDTGAPTGKDAGEPTGIPGTPADKNAIIVRFKMA